MRPENLFLTEDGVLKLFFFGFVTQAEYYSKKKEWNGIRSFAPEVCYEECCVVVWHNAD